jgi:hypothetical protein
MIKKLWNDLVWSKVIAAAPEVEAAVRRMLKHKIRRVSISARPAHELELPGETRLVDIKSLESGE